MRIKKETKKEDEPRPQKRVHLLWENSASELENSISYFVT